MCQYQNSSKKLAAQPGTVVKWLPCPVYHIPRFASLVKRSLVLLINFIPRQVTSDILLIHLTRIIRALPIPLLAIHRLPRCLLSRPSLGKHSRLSFAPLHRFIVPTSVFVLFSAKARLSKKAKLTTPTDDNSATELEKTSLLIRMLTLLWMIRYLGVRILLLNRQK